MTPWWGSLLFVMVGALLSGVTGYALWRAQKRQERRDKLNDARREALAHALAWIEPLDYALRQAEIEIYRLLDEEQSLDDFHANYDSLFPKIAQLDLPAQRRLVLDGDPYPLLHGIRHNIARVRFESVELWHDTSRRPKEQSRPLTIEEARERCSIRLHGLHQQLDALRRQLSEDYRKTYE